MLRALIICAFGSCLLAQYRLNMTIVGPDGQPLPGAYVSRPILQRDRADSDGLLTVHTGDKWVVVRQEGFESARVSTDGPSDVRVTMKPIPGGAEFRKCLPAGLHWNVENGSLRLPQTKGFRASKVSRDVDYGVRVYSTAVNGKRAVIRHGTGPTWSWGLPSDQAIQAAAVFRESVYPDIDILAIIDARGSDPNGKYWRFVGKFNETVEYANVDEAAAKVLDRVIDGACLAR